MRKRGLRLPDSRPRRVILNPACGSLASTADVNVKASSPEGIGALGRDDGMAAAAIVLLEAD